MFDPLENDLEDEAFPPLPAPRSPGHAGRDEGDPFGDEDGDVSKLADVPAAKRKGVKRPQPKLDSNRLVSERGLPALRTLFENVHFKGKGHEAEDLRLLMKKMENWAHRLYPKLQFEDFVDRVEKLGSKKEVQTCLKRIRLDMPLTHEDYMGNDGEEAAAPESHIFGDPDPFNSTSFSNDLPIHSTPAPPAPPAPSQTSLSPPAPSLTEEQRRRIELNRQRALERKLARQQQQTDPSHSQTADEPTSVSSSAALNGSREERREEDSELEPVSSSTQQPGQLPHKHSEPPAESPPPENEEETKPSEVHEPGDGCEHGD
ncbi:TIMELESS-interacting protein [Morone saxatilis]|uniref:TIMELESS-interacting protein n=1 Tax=Morone saxatilis TaxID=34816 RepID=UPI0015E2415D|nr:TIMELESS-interacting protein [Morone saxatilis]